ncbi:MAG: hypothetical protein EP314_01075 [Bacteroidetes bacterium]|nr:MAG: hypothetical protein EP314_01075 [Bacteroidota bacterium]
MRGTIYGIPKTWDVTGQLICGIGKNYGAMRGTIYRIPKTWDGTGQLICCVGKNTDGARFQRVPQMHYL